MLKIAWMSDPHFTQEGKSLGHDPRVRVRLAVDHINAHHSDAQICVISGDLVNRCTREDYEGLRGILSTLAMPFLPLMGNHDQRDLLRDTLPLPTTGMTDFIQYTYPTDEGVVVCLDTHRTGSDGGEFCETRLDWLEKTLSEAGDCPVFLFMHHPPMKLGLPMQDIDNNRDGDRLLDLLSAFPSVSYLFIGHVHRPISGTVRGIPFSTMRSVLYQAPAPRPEWDWSSFKPAEEAPAIGIVSIADGDVILQYDQFCRFEDGVE